MNEKIYWIGTTTRPTEQTIDGKPRWGRGKWRLTDPLPSPGLSPTRNYTCEPCARVDTIWFLWSWYLINVCLWNLDAARVPSFSTPTLPGLYRRFINEPFIKFMINMNHIAIDGLAWHKRMISIDIDAPEAVLSRYTTTVDRIAPDPERSDRIECWLSLSNSRSCGTANRSSFFSNVK